MANVAVVGAQWGDEGKGKLVDWLSNRADVVVRFQGGHNAGHTLVVGEKVYKLSLLPSGVVQGKLSVIGNGVVVDPWALLDEIARIGAQGVEITPDLLVLADNATLILPIPMRTRSAAGRSASRTLPIPRLLKARSNACWPTTRPCAGGLTCPRSILRNSSKP